MLRWMWWAILRLLDTIPSSALTFWWTEQQVLGPTRLEESPRPHLLPRHPGLVMAASTNIKDHRQISSIFLRWGGGKEKLRLWLYISFSYTTLSSFNHQNDYKGENMSVNFLSGVISAGGIYRYRSSFTEIPSYIGSSKILELLLSDTSNLGPTLKHSCTL